MDIPTFWPPQGATMTDNGDRRGPYVRREDAEKRIAELEKKLKDATCSPPRP